MSQRPHHREVVAAFLLGFNAEWDPQHPLRDPPMGIQIPELGACLKE
jgi:hypothetical protein